MTLTNPLSEYGTMPKTAFFSNYSTSTFHRYCFMGQNFGVWKENGCTERVQYYLCKRYMSRLVTKPTKWYVRPAKTQISLGIRPVWSESSLSAWKKLESLATHWAHSEDSDQIGRMPRLIWVFAGRTCHFVGFVTRRLSHECWYKSYSNIGVFEDCRRWNKEQGS